MESIQKEIHLRAPRSRVWRALSDKTAFGAWFGVDIPAGKFAAGENVLGQVTITGYEHVKLDIEVVEVTPEERLSYRWHPYAVDPAIEYSAEPRPLVTFTLEDTDVGTLLKVVESGFENIPLHRRAEAFRMNDGGWAGQMKNIERYVTETR